MGIWEWMGSTATSVKDMAPDAVKNGCQATYDYGSAAVKGVTNNAGQWIPDQESRSKMGLYTTKFAKNAGLYAVKEGYTIIPGGSAFSKILSDTMNEVKNEKLIDQKLRVFEDKLKQATDQHSNDAPKASHDPAGILGGSGVKPSPNGTFYAGSVAGETPQDVIRVFMMKEFIGNRLLSDLMVSNIRKEGKNPE